MKEFFYKRWVKICAVILCIVSFNAAVFSLVVMVVGESEGIYENTAEEIREDMCDRVCNEYSISAIIRYTDNFGMNELGRTNFRYGVIQADSLDGIDLNDKSNYEVCNFDKEVTEDMLFVHSYDMGPSTSFYMGKSLFDPSYIYNSREYQAKKSVIVDYYYARDSKTFYCQTEEENFYPVTPNDDILGGYAILEGDDGEQEYVWDGSQEITFNDQTWNLSEIPIVLQKDLYEMGTVISQVEGDAEYVDYSTRNGYVVVPDYAYGDTKPYYVLSYVHEPLQDENGFFEKNIFRKLELWDKQDYFVQASVWIDFIVGIRYLVFGGFLIFSILFVLSFAAAMIGAGHQNTKEITPALLDKMPFDLFFALFVCVFWVGILIVMACVYYMDFLVYLWLGGISLLLLESLCMVFLMSVATRIKLKNLFRNTICWRLWHRFYGFLKRNIKKIEHAIPFLWKAWLIMGGLAFLELIGLSVTAFHPEAQVLLWFIEKVLLYAAITICLLQMKQLLQAGEKLAAGELNSGLDTDRMFWDFKQHGDNLNNIREGISHAVADQLKSEHFKTELITNVSHDIKTPLTSIINYVDLLEKEEIDNSHAKEYLEVLSRQSKRLKKLIEDLMEASKASTGNLAVVYESCDAHVMLTQTIGEFEEKLKASQVELIVKGSDEPIFIEADPRHLWRIFENLMNNICKYAQPSTRAYVNIEKQGSLCRIIFRNISKYALNIDSEELMERFVRGDSSRNTEGSGLGLSIANSLTELMQGTFTLVVDGDLFKVIVTFRLADVKETKMNIAN